MHVKKKLLLRHACQKKTNNHIYKNGHNWGQKYVPRHDSDAIRREI